MRSFDRTMPEELNRVLADHASDLLLCPSEAAVENLQRESVAGEIELVGDVMVDVALSRAAASSERARRARGVGLRAGEFVLATAHRAGNVDDPGRLGRLVELLLAIPLPVVLPLHPRTRARLEPAGLLEQLERSEHLIVTPPLGYVELSALLCNARAVLTDSGGLQKEAYLAGVPCMTLRPTHRVDGDRRAGWNMLVDLDREARAGRARADARRPSGRRCTATATPASASSPLLHCTTHEAVAAMSDPRASHRRRRARLLGPEPGPQLRVASRAASSPGAATPRRRRAHGSRRCSRARG